jgi:hypothetical protein
MVASCWLFLLVPKVFKEYNALTFKDKEEDKGKPPTE